MIAAGIHMCCTRSTTLASDQGACSNAGEKSPIGVSVLCTAFVRTRIATSVRNRPSRFGGPSDEPANPQMATLVAAGIDPAFVAERVLAGIADNDLYILTHPELRDVIAGRFDRILAAFDKAALLETAPPEVIAARA